ncbi:MAG TPA: TIR domain-containing protein [Sphingomonadaceae bacterium]|nr:TIR domain-containing protein [Sphingomonadaceae bacterium]
MSSPDIFLSYNREDAARAKHFADGFAAEGFEVWWDVSLRSGEAYDQVTEEALSNAKAVVVLWSPRSVVSRWVRAEATEAERNKTLLPVMIEPCKRPIMFELVQTAELSHWRGDTDDAAWQAFLGHVRSFVGKDVPAPATESPQVKPGQTSVVVLPFANMSNDPEQEYFADGITEDIITDLSKVSALMVIARNTAFTFKGKHVDIKDVARQLGVTHVLEGSVRKAGNRLRITAQLIDGATGGHVWAERYDRELADIFDIQDEISEAIVGVLKLKLLPAEKKAIEVRLTKSAEAYDHYIRARALRATMIPASMRKAIGAYRKALELDPEFAMAWAGLASNLMVVGSLFPGRADISQDEIDQAIDRAASLAPGLPDVVASTTQLSLARHDWEKVEDCISRFEELQDNNWTAHSTALLVLGRANAAVDQQRKVANADPLSVGASWALQFALDCAGRLDEADAEYEKTKDFAGSRATFEWQACARMMALKDHARLKQRFLLNAHEQDQRQPYALALAEAIDDPKQALGILRDAFENPANRSVLVMDGIAHWAAYFGDFDLALAALRLAILELAGTFLMDLWHPNFAPMRRDPRFKQIVIDLGLPDHWRKSGNWGDFARPVGDDDFELVTP